MYLFLKYKALPFTILTLCFKLHVIPTRIVLSELFIKHMLRNESAALFRAQIVRWRSQVRIACVSNFTL